MQEWVSEKQLHLQARSDKYPAARHPLPSARYFGSVESLFLRNGLHRTPAHCNITGAGTFIVPLCPQAFLREADFALMRPHIWRRFLSS